jgi:uncharacterized protein
MKPSLALEAHRDAIRGMVGKYRTSNPRVFGSVARGEDGEDSDLDILVDTLPGTTMFDLGGLQYELQELLGIKVDLVTTGELHRRIKNQVLTEAKSV